MHFLSSIVLLMFSHLVIAHAPELHKKESIEKPQCQVISQMDLSTMDKNDPVMQAMMQQCEGWFHDDHHEIEKAKPVEQKQK